MQQLNILKEKTSGLKITVNTSFSFPNFANMMQHFSTKLFLMVSVSFIQNMDAANILALVVTPSPSHHIWNRALMLELAARGHNVTVVSPDPEKQKIPNHTDIYIEGMYEELHQNYDYEAMGDENVLQNYISIYQWGVDGCEKGLQSKGAKQLLDLVNKQSFDLIIVEAVVDDCFLGFVPLFGSPPLIAITAYSLPHWAADMTGSPNTPSYINVGNLPYPQHMTLLQRTINFIVLSFSTTYRRFFHMPTQDKIARKYLGSHIPPLADIENNISLVLTNIHDSFDYPRPLSPNLIPVGGMHIKPAKPLPKEIKDFLDDAPDGAILFSLGSNIRSDKLNEEKRKVLLKAFAQLKQKVLWKWESETLPGKPPNVKISKWLPQNDVLAHPNIRLFMTHGGLLSTQEALYHGVPMVGIPFLADQHINLEKNVRRGVAEKLDVHNLATDTIVNTLKKILNNPSYKEKIQNLSDLFRDRPDTALNTAVWWIEFVIRHKGAHHLRTAALELHWHQYFLLDVITVLTFSFLIILILFVKFFKIIIKLCFKSKKDITKKKRS